MQENFEFLQSDDVVEIKELEDKSVKDLINAMGISYLFKVGNFIESLADPKNLLKEGISCRVMTTRKNGWVNGKIKLSLQFTPDEDIDTDMSTSSEKQSDIVEKNDCESVVYLESSLDEIRNLSIL